MDRFISLIDEMAGIAERNPKCDKMGPLLESFVDDGKMRIQRLSKKAKTEIDTLSGDQMDKVRGQVYDSLLHFEKATAACPGASDSLDALVDTAFPRRTAAREGVKEMTAIFNEMAAISEAFKSDCPKAAESLEAYLQTNGKRLEDTLTKLDNAGRTPKALEEDLDAAMDRFFAVAKACPDAMATLQPYFEKKK